jgi:hypothetical protein
MDKPERRRRYRILLSDGVTITEVSRKTFEEHLAAHRVETFRHDGRKAATKEGWLSYVHFQTGELIFAARETEVGVRLDGNWQSIINNLKFRPPFDEWAMRQHDQVYGQAAL